MGALIHDPEYVQGQIAALFSLLLGVAQWMPKEEFRERSLAQLETLRTAILDTTASDVRLVAVEHAEDQVRKVMA